MTIQGAPYSGNAKLAGQQTRGWILGHFMPGEDHPLRTRDVELKWCTHAAGETRPEWSPPAEVRTLNVLLHGRLVLVFPEEEIVLASEGDFVIFGPGIAHSYRSEQESLVLTVRWPSLP
jgi:hypothetical protein